MPCRSGGRIGLDRQALAGAGQAGDRKMKPPGLLRAALVALSRPGAVFKPCRDVPGYLCLMDEAPEVLTRPIVGLPR